MMANLSCVEFQSSSFYLRNSCCKGNLHTTLGIFVVQAVIASALAAIAFMYYNSIAILNMTIHIEAISNTWWILYFVISTLRAVLNSVKYAIDVTHVKSLEVTDWCIGAVKVLILFFALNYQRKYRSSDHITKEIENVNKSGRQLHSKNYLYGFLKVLSSSGLVLSTFAIVTFASIILAVIFLSKENSVNSGMQYLFWIYIGSLAWNGVVSLILAFFAMNAASSSGPSLLAKVTLFLAVILSLPSDLPLYLWNQCIFIHSTCFIDQLFSVFDIAIVFNMISLVLFFLVMRMEYMRLKQECQFAMLSEVQQCRI